MKLLNQFTTMTNNGIWTVGPSDDPKMHARISEGGFALLKARAAPAGWEKRLSGTNGREFLHNPATGQSQWPKTGASYEKVRSIYDGPTMTQNLLADEGAIVGALFEQGELSRPMFGIVFQAVRVVYVDLRHLDAKATLRGGAAGRGG